MGNGRYQQTYAKICGIRVNKVRGTAGRQGRSRVWFCAGRRPRHSRGVLIGTGVVVGVGVNYAWDNLVKPGVSWIYVNVVRTNDPFIDIRNLAPIGSGS